jgi:hypothetical protein
LDARLLSSGDVFEIDKASLHIDRHKLNVNAISYIKAFETLHQLTLDRKIDQPHSGAFFGCSGDEGIELLTDP